jgi:hypothetical protein
MQKHVRSVLRFNAMKIFIISFILFMVFVGTSCLWFEAGSGSYAIWSDPTSKTLGVLRGDLKVRWVLHPCFDHPRERSLTEWKGLGIEYRLDKRATTQMRRQLAPGRYEMVELFLCRTYFAVSVDMWWTFLLAIPLPLAIARQIKRRRYRAGHCQNCGYNLRGNVTGVCSECGVRCRECDD